jgi:transposase
MCYSHFCTGYRAWTKTLKRYLRQTHVAGERVFVDYAGPTMDIVDRATGEIRHVQIFVGVLGASNYIYVEAHGSQRVPDWLAAHTRMFEFFGGVPAIIVCDNLKSAVIKASRTEPVINPAYQHLADHYGILILPARPRKPKDKGKAENAVLVVERWMLFCLRKRVFYSLAELNTALLGLLDKVNEKPFQKLPGSRRSTFESIDQPRLRPLPQQAFEYAEFRELRIGLDARIEVDGGIYSVPFGLVRQVVELRLTANTLEILHRGQRVASHARTSSSVPVINPQHLEPAHRHFSLWDADQALDWALTLGSGVHGFLQMLLAAARAREQGYRAVGSLKKLAKQYGVDRLDAACHRAIGIGAHTLASVRSILSTGLDRQARDDTPQEEAAFDHPNVRGPKYYH